MSQEKIEPLVKIAKAIVDPVLDIIPESPRFCLNSSGGFRILDAETLASMQASDQDYRAVIARIDNSGPTGIGYILKTLPDNQPDLLRAFDQVLIGWQARFPMDGYTRANGEQAKQDELNFHEGWLDKIDRFLDNCVWEELPKQVRQIPDLEAQLKTTQEWLEDLLDRDYQDASLAWFRAKNQGIIAQKNELEARRMEVESQDEQDLIDIELQKLNEGRANLKRRRDNYINVIATETPEKLEAEMNVLQTQLKDAQAVRDNLDIFPLRSLAVVRAGVEIAKSKEKWSVILNFDQSEFRSLLVINAVDALKERDYRLLDEEASGNLIEHLKARRELQAEKRSNAESSLRTLSVSRSEPHLLSTTEVRDPIDRKLFIDTTTATDGSNFCHIIVGAWLCAVEHSLLESSSPLDLPENIQECITQKSETEPTYAGRAKMLFQQFSDNRLVLPSEQMEVLAQYGLCPASPPRKPTYHGANPFGLLAQNNNAGSGSRTASAPERSLAPTV